MVCLFVLFMAAPAGAKVFKNAYLSFEIPNTWDCQLEQTEGVCRSGEPGLAQGADPIDLKVNLGTPEPMPKQTPSKWRLGAAALLLIGSGLSLLWLRGQSKSKKRRRVPMRERPVARSA